MYWLTFGRGTAAPVRPSRQFMTVRRRRPYVVHGKIDTQAEPELAATLGIRSVPTIMAFRDGMLVYSRVGAMPPVELENLITQVKSLDMNAVHAKIAARPAGVAPLTTKFCGRAGLTGWL